LERKDLILFLSERKEKKKRKEGVRKRHFLEQKERKGLSLPQEPERLSLQPDGEGKKEEY